MLVNISRAYYQMENYGEAQTYFSKAQAIDPQQVEQYTYLAQASGGEARAAEERDLSQEILFLEEEE
ncbi:unnamed protein product [marine sediment metagenome]|uniref:Uncharacterized protein n=1 Tax=marine sediment metagenome TaxID=412755 RepID=X1HHF8_9ZZZZ